MWLGRNKETQFHTRCSLQPSVASELPPAVRAARWAGELSSHLASLFSYLPCVRGLGLGSGKRFDLPEILFLVRLILGSAQLRPAWGQSQQRAD